MSFTSLWGNLLKIAVWLKSKLREKRDLYRYCDEHYRIQYTKSTEVNNVNYIWKDQLRYQPIQRKSIVETDNNIGYISVSNSTIEHKLLTIKSRGE